MRDGQFNNDFSPTRKIYEHAVYDRTPPVNELLNYRVTYADRLRDSRRANLKVKRAYGYDGHTFAVVFQW